MPTLPDNLPGRLRAAEINAKTAVQLVSDSKELINMQSARIEKLERQNLDMVTQINTLRGLVMARMGSGATS